MSSTDWLVTALLFVTAVLSYSIAGLGYYNEAQLKAACTYHCKTLHKKEPIEVHWIDDKCQCLYAVGER